MSTHRGSPGLLGSYGGVPLGIGEVAREAGVGIDTVRYYERLGVLPAPERRPSGYRRYEASSIHRIRMVKQLQDLGMTLGEIAEFVDAVVDEGADCHGARKKLEAALGRIDERLAAIKMVRRRLTKALGRCSDGSCDLAERVRSSSGGSNSCNEPRAAR